MKTYTVKSVNTGRTAVVQAASEDDARHFAMVEFWGPPTGMYAPRYKGRGLVVV